ncbi:MAG: ATP-binding protein [Chromatiales bacterium]|nr:ATP-binding protein [Chromatiales bacterium]
MLSNTIKPLLDRVRNRPDTELEQALIRVIITIGVILYLFSTAESSVISDKRLLALQLLSVFLTASIAIVIAIIANPQISVSRRIFGIAIDMAGFSFFMATTYDLVVPWYPVYLWVAFGNGFRFGEKYLYLSATLAVIGFSAVLIFNEYWHQNLAMGIGLLVALIVLPGYAAVLTRRINQEKQKAEKANRAKSEFLARMSHEIRTPLNGIIATGELLKSCQLNNEEREYADTIQTSGATLLRIIEDILDISKIEAGKLLIERIDFDLHQLVDNSVKLFAAEAKQRNLELLYTIDSNISPTLVGDPLHLRQVLTNLIGNAIKFTREGHIHIRCTETGKQSDQAIIKFEIEDTGIGMSEETLKRLFDKFTQADESTTRQYGGTGLGTTIAKQLVLLMNGQIDVHSELGAGTTFWFEIPLTIQPKLSDQEIVETLDSYPIVKITPPYLGETEADKLLRKWGIATVPFNNHQAAIEYLNSDENNIPIRCILLDHYLPSSCDLDQKALLISTDTLLINIQPSHIVDNETHPSIYQLQPPLNPNRLYNTLHLSLIRQLAATRAQINFGENCQASLNILVAEDNTTNRMVIGRILEKAGHRYRLVENGQEALDILEQQNFDLIVIDMHMPVLGGLEAYKMYQFAHPDSNTPFIMLTANATTDAQIACREAGIKYYMTKPISAHKLLSIIEIASAGKEIDGPGHFIPEHGTVFDNTNTTIDQSILNDVVNLAPNSKFLTELLESFDRDSLELISAMTKAIESNDAITYSDLAHALKGSASNLGLVKIQNLALDAEKLTPDQLKSNGQIQIEQLHSALQEAKSILTLKFSDVSKTLH